MITDEMVEWAAEAIWQSEPVRSGGRRRTLWPDESDETRGRYWPLARAALEAVLPMIRAEVDNRHGFGDLVSSAYAEADKAMRKFPQPNYVISKVAEEAGEVVKAAIHCAEKRETAENVAGEMKQLIAMLYRLWVEGDQVHGLTPIAEAIRAMKGGET
jgi:phosphoribosyl-ATP pyrophosphohydrolase